MKPSSPVPLYQRKEPHRQPRKPGMSAACARGLHSECFKLNCSCDCPSHKGFTVGENRRKKVR